MRKGVLGLMAFLLVIACNQNKPPVNTSEDRSKDANKNHTDSISSKVTQDSMAKSPSFFLAAAGKQMKWEIAAEPAHIVGPIYFVGTTGLSSFLITTSKGNILLYTGMPSSGPMIEQSIKKLGFNPGDIKILLTGHAHIDHVGGHAYIKKISGAQVAIMDSEKELIESGGKADFHYGSYPEFNFEPVLVDRILHDGDKVTLGDVTMTALHTGGHTKGTTTWLMTVQDSGKKYNVVFPDGTSINPGYRLVLNPSYPGIQDDYRKTMATLEGLKPDIWLTCHTDFFNFEQKQKLAATKGPAAFVDPVGYRQRIASAKKNFETVIKKETGNSYE